MRSSNCSPSRYIRCRQAGKRALQGLIARTQRLFLRKPPSQTLSPAPVPVPPIPSSPPPTPFPFFRLSHEIRDKIYHHLLQKRYNLCPIRLPSACLPANAAEDTPAIVMCMLLVSHQMHAEFSTLLFATAIFCYETSYYQPHVLTQAPIGRMQSVEVEVDIWDYCGNDHYHINYAPSTCAIIPLLTGSTPRKSFTINISKCSSITTNVIPTPFLTGLSGLTGFETVRVEFSMDVDADCYQDWQGEADWKAVEQSAMILEKLLLLELESGLGKAVVGGGYEGCARFMEFRPREAEAERRRRWGDDDDSSEEDWGFCS